MLNKALSSASLTHTSISHMNFRKLLYIVFLFTMEQRITKFSDCDKDFWKNLEILQKTLQIFSQRPVVKDNFDLPARANEKLNDANGSSHGCAANDVNQDYTK